LIPLICKSQVYLRSAQNATILPHLLAHPPNILAKEKEIWQKREVGNGKRATHYARQMMWQRQSAESAWQRGNLLGRPVNNRFLHTLGEASNL
jgi:hypothetical protein